MHTFYYIVKIWRQYDKILARKIFYAHYDIQQLIIVIRYSVKTLLFFYLLWVWPLPLSEKYVVSALYVLTAILFGLMSLFKDFAVLTKLKKNSFLSYVLVADVLVTFWYPGFFFIDNFLAITKNMLILWSVYTDMFVISIFAYFWMACTVTGSNVFYHAKIQNWHGTLYRTWLFFFIIIFLGYISFLIIDCNKFFYAFENFSRPLYIFVMFFSFPLGWKIYNWSNKNMFSTKWKIISYEPVLHLLFTLSLFVIYFLIYYTNFLNIVSTMTEQNFYFTVLCLLILFFFFWKHLFNHFKCSHLWLKYFYIGLGSFIIILTQTFTEIFCFILYTNNWQIFFSTIGFCTCVYFLVLIFKTAVAWAFQRFWTFIWVSLHKCILFFSLFRKHLLRVFFKTVAARRQTTSILCHIFNEFFISIPAINLLYFFVYLDENVFSQKDFLKGCFYFWIIQLFYTKINGMTLTSWTAQNKKFRLFFEWSLINFKFIDFLVVWAIFVIKYLWLQNESFILFLYLLTISNLNDWFYNNITISKWTHSLIITMIKISNVVVVVVASTWIFYKTVYAFASVTHLLLLYTTFILLNFLLAAIIWYILRYAAMQFAALKKIKIILTLFFHYINSGTK